MDDGESSSPGKGVWAPHGPGLGGWESGTQRRGDRVHHIPYWTSGSCAHTYLICSVVKSVEAQVPLGKCRRWTQTEEERGTYICAEPPDSGVPGTGLGLGGSLPLEWQVLAFKTPHAISWE